MNLDNNKKNDSTLEELKNQMGEKKFNKAKKVLEKWQKNKGNEGNEGNTDKVIENLTDHVQGKSEDDLLSELLELSKKLSTGDNKKEFKKKLKMLELFRNVLNDKQKEKLDKIIKMLKESN